MFQHYRRISLLAPCAAALLAGLWLMPAFAQMSPPQETGASAPEPYRMSVAFSHDGHNKKAKLKNCTVCHHPLPGPKRGQLVKGPERRCSDCHHLRPGPADFAPSLVTASHKMCQGCHKAKKKGPVKCSGCHKNEPQTEGAGSAASAPLGSFGSFMSPAVPGVPATEPQAESGAQGAN
jgi:hypothetical protein